MHPDDFICELVRDDPVSVRKVLEAHRYGLLRPPLDCSEYAAAFVHAGLVQAAAMLWP